MSFNASVIADSMSPDGFRLLTMELTYPRIVHGEFMTHRDLARNSASTRARHLLSQLRDVLENPFIPAQFGINQSGMQSYQFLSGIKHDEAAEIWLQGRDRALTTFIELILGLEESERVLQYEPSRDYVPSVVFKEQMEELRDTIPSTQKPFDSALSKLLNVHKQLAGRGLEAYMWHTTVMSATTLDNFLALRDHGDAQGEIATIARLMRQAVGSSTSRFIDYGEWHLPYVDEGEFEDLWQAIRSSSARAAAVSFNRQHNKNLEGENKRYHFLRDDGHMSPLEHPATPFTPEEWAVRRSLMHHAKTMGQSRGLTSQSVMELVRSLERLGNFSGWTQHRKQIPGEHNFALLQAV